MACKPQGRRAREPGPDRSTTRSENATASPKTLAELGISKQQSSDWQKLAAVPREEFEQALESKNVESLVSYVKQGIGGPVTRGGQIAADQSGLTTYQKSILGGNVATLKGWVKQHKAKGLNIAAPAVTIAFMAAIEVIERIGELGPIKMGTNLRFSPWLLTIHVGLLGEEE